MEIQNNETICENKEERRRQRNIESNRRYMMTAKGKKANAAKCKKYFQSHRDKCQTYVVAYKKAFLEKYGIGFNTWNYWRRKIVNKKCQESDIPPKFGAILADWKLKQGIDNATDDVIDSSTDNM